jgi:hypothetical protein
MDPSQLLKPAVNQAELSDFLRKVDEVTGKINALKEGKLDEVEVDEEAGHTKVRDALSMQ